MAGALRTPIMAAMSGRETSSLVTRGLRLARIVLHLLHGLLTATLFFPFFSKVRCRQEIKTWSCVLLRILRLQVHLHGTPARVRPLMLVANHVSWLDIFAMNSVNPVRFVAKSEIRRWPVIGLLSARTGTLFIERGRRRDTARVNGLIAEAMLEDDVVAVFPEGTTTDGSQVLRFHSSLLQPALIADAAVQPIALRFTHKDGSLCVDAAYDGDKSLWQSLLQIIAWQQMDAHLYFLPLLAKDVPHRRALADAAHAAIASRLTR
jgi:1-acyl-sn-glycerol-3-phosphate acyltransferase